MKISRNDIVFYLGLLFAFWFALTAMVWTYWIALVVAYPFGISSFLLWRSIKNENKKRTKLIPIILAIGLVLSLATLVYLLIWD